MSVIMITGCSRPTGFGQLTARAFAAAGHDVYATMRKPERGANLEEQAAAAGMTLHVIEQDVTNPASNRRAVEIILERSGRLDVLVNNAAVSTFGALETMTDEDYRSVMETNFFGSVDATRAVLPTMRKQKGGRILFVTSLGGCIGLPSETAYGASKFAVEGMAEGLWYEVKRFGIDVSIVAPAFFNTGEDPRLVADMILDAATTANPALRWWPGEKGPKLAAARQAMSDSDWLPMMASEMNLGWWVEGREPD